MTEKRWLRLPRPEGDPLGEWYDWQGPYEVDIRGPLSLWLANVLREFPDSWTLPVGQPDETGWIPWDGGECPVADGTKITAKWRDRDITPSGNPEWLWWDHHGSDGDIIAYRIEQPAEPEAPTILEILSEWWDDADDADGAWMSVGGFEPDHLGGIGYRLDDGRYVPRDWFTGRRHLTTEELAEEMEG